MEIKRKFRPDSNLKLMDQILQVGQGQVFQYNTYYCFFSFCLIIQEPMIMCLSLNIELPCPGSVELAKENRLPGP